MTKIKEDGNRMAMFRTIGRWIEKINEAHKKKRQEQAEWEHEQKQFQQDILAMLNEGKVPDFPDINYNNQLPFMLMKSEHLVYVFENVRYGEMRPKSSDTRRSNTRRSNKRSPLDELIDAGLDIAVSSVTLLNPGDSYEIVNKGKGIMGITTKHIYFSGHISFRIKFSEIVSLRSRNMRSRNNDTVEIIRNGVRQSELFLVGQRDIQFAYDLLQSISSLKFERGEHERPQVVIIEKQMNIINSCKQK